MSVSGSPFCEHKKLRMSCAICKPAAPLPAATKATPFVTRDEREAKAEKRAAADPEKRAAGTPGGPGKPLMPKKKVKRGVTADEADHAQAWWVKKR